MTKEQKELLLKDLCARLPYGVKVRSKIPINQNESKEIVGQVTSVHYNVGIVQVGGFDVIVDYNPYFEIKPYLFPLSSITEEQKNDCPINETNLNIMTSNIGYGIIEMPWKLSYLFVDWCNKNHFDYRGLIPMGMANNATGLNIY